MQIRDPRGRESAGFINGGIEDTRIRTANG
jgi:hypothetical protein